MKKAIQSLLILVSTLGMAACGETSNVSSTTPVSSQSSEQVKKLVFPTDVKIYKNLDDYKLSPIWIGEGRTESITYSFNSEYIDIDEEGVVTPIKKGFSKVTATTPTQSYDFQIEIKDSNEFRFAADIPEMENLYKEHDSPKETNLFMGDSFFDPRASRGFWTSFYDDFAGKNVFCEGIAATQINDWMVMRDELIRAVAPKNVFIHLGTNDINDAGNTGVIVGNEMKTFVEYLHSDLPDTHFYIFGIEESTNKDFAKNSKKREQANELYRSFADSVDYATYLDSPSRFNDKLDQVLKPDGLHPNAEGYKIYVDMTKDLVD